MHTHTCWLRSSPRLGHTRHTSRTSATKFGHGPAQALASGPFAAVRLHRASRTPTPAVVRWWQRSRQRGRTPAASRRLPGPHSSGGRFPPQRPPALKTSRPSSPRSPSSLPGAVSRSSSPSIGRPSRPCVSATQARVSRSSSRPCLSATQARVSRSSSEAGEAGPASALRRHAFLHQVKLVKLVVGLVLEVEHLHAQGGVLDRGLVLLGEVKWDP